MIPVSNTSVRRLCGQKRRGRVVDRPARRVVGQRAVLVADLAGDVQKPAEHGVADRNRDRPADAARARRRALARSSPTARWRGPVGVEMGLDFDDERWPVGGVDAQGIVDRGQGAVGKCDVDNGPADRDHAPLRPASRGKPQSPDIAPAPTIADWRWCEQRQMQAGRGFRRPAARERGCWLTASSYAGQPCAGWCGSCSGLSQRRSWRAAVSSAMSGMASAAAQGRDTTVEPGPRTCRATARCARAGFGACEHFCRAVCSAGRSSCWETPVRKW